MLKWAEKTLLRNLGTKVVKICEICKFLLRVSLFGTL